MMMMLVVADARTEELVQPDVGGRAATDHDRASHLQGTGALTFLRNSCVCHFKEQMLCHLLVTGALPFFKEQVC